MFNWSLPETFFDGGSEELYRSHGTSTWFTFEYKGEIEDHITWSQKILNAVTRRYK